MGKMQPKGAVVRPRWSHCTARREAEGGTMRPLRCGQPATRGLHFFHGHPIKNRVNRIVITFFPIQYLISLLPLLEPRAWLGR